MNECPQLSWLCAKSSLRDAGRVDQSLSLQRETSPPLHIILTILGYNSFSKISASLIQL